MINNKIIHKTMIFNTLSIVVFFAIFIFISCDSKKSYKSESIDVIEQQAIEQYQIDSIKRIEAKRLSSDKSKRQILKP